jgi:DNA-binding protein Fis
LKGIQATRESAPGPDPSILPAEDLRLDELKEKLVRQAMERAGGNKSRAAKILGISRDQIRYRLEKMGL